MSAAAPQTTFGRIVANIARERMRQDEKFGEQNHPDGKWALILLEELGEAAKAMLENDQPHADQELTQAAAVTVAWLEARARRTP